MRYRCRAVVAIDPFARRDTKLAVGDAGDTHHKKCYSPTSPSAPQVWGHRDPSMVDPVALVAEVRRLRGAVSELEAENSGLRDRNSALEDELAELRGEVSATEAERDKLKNAYKKKLGSTKREGEHLHQVG